MKELDGWSIPNLNPTADGTCVGDPVAAADAANRGWWSCGGYTRPDGIFSFVFSLGPRVVMMIQTLLLAPTSSRGE
jgi:hypothetical protein